MSDDDGTPLPRVYGAVDTQEASLIPKVWVRSKGGALAVEGATGGQLSLIGRAHLVYEGNVHI
jgi:hypothetical protein